MRSVKQSISWERATEAVEMARRIVPAKAQGVYGSVLPYDAMKRVNLGNALRQFGVPVFAPKHGGNTKWYILSGAVADTDIAKEVVINDVTDHYVRACRLHMSMCREPAYSGIAQILFREAIALGGELGIDPAQTMADLRPSTFVEHFNDQLVEIGALRRNNT